MPGSDYLEAIVLGVVQGLAEFLPISSSGHLVILGEILRGVTGRSVDPESNLQMNVALHVGTLLSILWVYRADLPGLLNRRSLCAGIAVATLPLVVVALTPLKDHVESLFASPLSAGIALLITAALLVVGQRLERVRHELDQVPAAVALLIGLLQATALIPGISRSGSTIAGGMLAGLRREASATFSFLIAIPAISGAAVLTAKDAWDGTGGAHSTGALLVGILVSFIVGLSALRWLLRMVSQRRLHWFAWYCAAAGSATVLWQLAV